MPFFVAGIVPFILGEKVPLLRWIVIAIGFGGVLVMTRPGSTIFQPEALFGFGLCIFVWVGSGPYSEDRSITSNVDHIIVAKLRFYIVLCELAMLFYALDMGEAGNKSLAFLTRAWTFPATLDLAMMIAAGVLSSLQLPLVVFRL